MFLSDSLYRALLALVAFLALSPLALLRRSPNLSGLRRSTLRSSPPYDRGRGRL